MKKIRSVLFLIISSTLFQCSPAERDVYLFSYFKNNGEDGLHLAYSYDGYKWTSLNDDRSFLKPQAGKDKLMRDPCIITGPDGLFHMVWTVSWGEKGIGYACSEDLLTWSDQRYLPVMEHEPDALNCWAPEIFYDEVSGHYMIFWATTIPGRFPETDYQNTEGVTGKGYNHRIYYVTTKNFRELSETRIFYDQGFNVIDATLIKSGPEHIMFLKDESDKPFLTQKNIRVARSRAAEGPFGTPSEPVTGPYWAEGPTVIRIENRWFLYFDKYQLGTYGLMVSDDLENWSDRSDRLLYPHGLRHGTVFKASGEILNRLMKNKP